MSSSSSNGSLFDPGFYFTIYFNLKCLMVPPGFIIFLTFSITYVLLLLPLCIFILHHGFQQWKRSSSTSSSSMTVSHSDVFTYHMVAMELFRIFASVLSCGTYIENFTLLNIAVFIFGFTWFGETFLHILTCVERYLAVVHPISYISLRSGRGIRMRNIIIVCVWMLSFAGMCVNALVSNSIILNFLCLVLSLIIVSFCSLSVLCVLIRPRPGEKGGNRERVDQSKLRAFYTIIIILGVLVFRFVCGLIWALLYISRLNDICMLMTFEFWVYLPGSLVLPLLFVQRAVKLQCCKKNIPQG